MFNSDRLPEPCSGQEDKPMSNAVLENILKIKDVLPKKQRILCNYLALNYEQVGVMTVAELAENAGVGNTTVMRLVQTLGFDSFSSFKRALVNANLLKNTTSYQFMKQGFSASDEAAESSDMLRRVVQDGMQVLENLCTSANMAQFEKAVQLMLRAKTIYTLGLRSSKVLALYFEYNVDRFHPNVRQLSRESEFVYDRVAVNATPEDVVLIYSIWPCTKKTIRVGQLCHKLGIPIILVTNTSLNPLAKVADVMIDTNTVNHSSGDTAIFAVTEALISELGRRTAPESTQYIERIERVLNENDLIMWETDI